MRSIGSTFGPWNIIKVLLKNLALVGLINVNLWVWEVLEAEEQAATTVCGCLAAGVVWLLVLVCCAV